MLESSSLQPGEFFRPASQALRGGFGPGREPFDARMGVRSSRKRRGSAEQRQTAQDRNAIARDS